MKICYQSVILSVAEGSIALSVVEGSYRYGLDASIPFGGYHKSFYTLSLARERVGVRVIENSTLHCSLIFTCPHNKAEVLHLTAKAS